MNESPDPKEKPCIVCNQIKCKGDTKRYRISEDNRAKGLLRAATFNKDSVHTRIIFLKTIGDVFAEDVMYHTNCLINYVTQFQRNVEDLMANDFENIDRTSQKEFLKNVLDNLEITKKERFTAGGPEL